MDKQTVEKISKKYGEAFYVLDLDKFEDNFLRFRKSFTDVYPNFNIAYSFKTNYIPQICEKVKDLGGYAEVVSDMELELAEKVGFLPERIIWNGPYKQPDKMKKLIIRNGIVNIDNVREFEEFKKLNIRKKVKIGLRINFDVGDGVISRFGFDPEGKDFQRIITYISKSDNIHLESLHCHFAKRNLEFWSKRVEGMIDVVDRIERKLKYLPSIIDLGGGIFGNMSKELSSQLKVDMTTYEDYGKLVSGLLIKRFPQANITVLTEPGTALAADCMSFIGKIDNIKNVRGKYFATMVCSQKNINMSGINPDIKVYRFSNNSKQYDELDIVGYTCIESDVLYRHYKGKLGAGDYIELFNAGSYSIVMKPPFILPNFPIIMSYRNKISLIKRKETFDDIFNTYIFKEINR